MHDARIRYIIVSRTRRDGSYKIWSFQIAQDGYMKGERLVFDVGQGRGGDGIRLDQRGNL